MFERACQKYVKRVMLLQFLALSLVHQLMGQNLKLLIHKTFLVLTSFF